MSLARLTPVPLLLAAHAALSKAGAIRPAADRLGISPTTLTKRLREGAERGLFAYAQRNRHHLERADIRHALQSARSVTHAAELLGVPPTVLRYSVTAHGLDRLLERSKLRMRRDATSRRAGDIFAQYSRLKASLGRDLSATDFVRLGKRWLYAQILACHGSIVQFRSCHKVRAPHLPRRVRTRPAAIAEPRSYALRYCARLQRELGHAPSSFELQDVKYPERRPIYTLILREWGGIGPFRRSLQRFVKKGGTG